MLILKAYVNHRPIDEIYVQNVEQLGEGLCGYKIRKPEVNIPIIYHYRQDGWRKLAKMVLQRLEETKWEK